MPTEVHVMLPATDLLTAEIIQHGTIDSAGANARVFDFVWHFQRIGIALDPSEVAVANAFHTAIGVPVMAALNARAEQSYISVRFMEDPLRKAPKFTHTLAGSITGDSMVMDDAAMLLINTALRGKSYQGRKHFGPMSESDTTTNGDVFNATCVTKLQTIATAALAGFTDSTPNTWKLGVYSRSLSQPTRQPNALIIWNAANQVLVNGTVRTMGSRRPVSTY